MRGRVGRGHSVAVQFGCGAELEAAARERYIDRDFPAALASWERAYAAYRAGSDAVGAVRTARTLAGMHAQISGDAALMNGWLGRAKTLLAAASDTAGARWVARNTARFESERPRRNAMLRDASGPA